jgi:hypothetical protein
MVQGTRALQVGHTIDMMALAGALQLDVKTTVADCGDDYGDKQVNQEQTMGAGHKGIASGTQYHNGRQDGSSGCTTARCNNHSSTLWRRAVLDLVL